MYQPNYYTDTTWVYDTLKIEVIDTSYVRETEYITVTDTLIIDVTITGIDPPNNLNTIKVYPNPTKDAIYIDTGSNYEQMINYKIKIVNTTGIVIFESNVIQPLFEIKTYSFGETGLCFIRLLIIPVKQ